MSPSRSVSDGETDDVLDLGADDLEVDEQALFVLDDLGLRGGDAEIHRLAFAGVAHDQPQRKRLGRLDLVGERIVGKHVVLQEVIQGQYRDRGKP